MRQVGIFLQIAGKIILTFILAFVIIGIISIPAGIIIGLTAVGTGDPSDMQAVIDKFAQNPLIHQGAMLLQLVGFVGAVAIMYALFEREKGWPLGYKQPQALAYLIRGVALGILLMTAAFLLILLLGGVSVTGIRWDSELLSSLVSAFILFTIVAINEELLSRGYMQGLIKYHFGTIPAILASSAIFAALHLLNPSILQNALPLLNLFLAGVLFAVTKEATGGLWLPIGLHLTWNFFQGNVFGFAVSGNYTESIILLTQKGNTAISGGSFGAEGSVITSIILIAAIYFTYRRVLTREQKALST